MAAKLYCSPFPFKAKESRPSLALLALLAERSRSDKSASSGAAVGCAVHHPEELTSYFYIVKLL